jgi:hypothetical protein
MRERAEWPARPEEVASLVEGRKATREVPDFGIRVHGPRSVVAPSVPLATDLAGLTRSATSALPAATATAVVGCACAVGCSWVVELLGDGVEFVCC